MHVLKFRCTKSPLSTLLVDYRKSCTSARRLKKIQAHTMTAPEVDSCRAKSSSSDAAAGLPLPWPRRCPLPQPRACASVLLLLRVLPPETPCVAASCTLLQRSGCCAPLTGRRHSPAARAVCSRDVRLACMDAEGRGGRMCITGPPVRGACWCCTCCMPRGMAVLLRTVGRCSSGLACIMLPVVAVTIENRSQAGFACLSACLHAMCRKAGAENLRLSAGPRVRLANTKADGISSRRCVKLVCVWDVCCALSVQMFAVRCLWQPSLRCL